MLAKSLSREHSCEPWEMMETKGLFLGDECAGSKILVLGRTGYYIPAQQHLPASWFISPRVQNHPLQEGAMVLWCPPQPSELQAVNYWKQNPGTVQGTWEKDRHFRAGNHRLGRPVGSAVPALEGNQGGWLPRFSQELVSSVTPSLTKKSSFPKISHAAGKRKKGQNDVGVHDINLLVHKNCLITGKIRKSIYYSEQLTPGAVYEGKHISQLFRPIRPQVCSSCRENTEILYAPTPPTLHIWQSL